MFSILLLLLTSIVMAETRLKLSFPDEFYNKQLSDSKFDRGTQSQNESKTKAGNGLRTQINRREDIAGKGLIFIMQNVTNNAQIRLPIVTLTFRTAGRAETSA